MVYTYSLILRRLLCPTGFQSRGRELRAGVELFNVIIFFAVFRI